MPQRSFDFELKSMDEKGQFTGLASTYEIDQVNDQVMPGAFARSLSEKGNSRVLLWQHRDPIGKVQLEDSSRGLIAHGQLSLGLQQAKDAHTCLKDGIVSACSIGFQTVKDQMVGSVRQLQEVKLWEVSLVTFPANLGAQILSVKSLEDRMIQRALDDLRRELKNF